MILIDTDDATITVSPPAHPNGPIRITVRQEGKEATISLPRNELYFLIGGLKACAKWSFPGQ